jgi:hypothetical protein
MQLSDLNHNDGDVLPHDHVRYDDDCDYDCAHDDGDAQDHHAAAMRTANLPADLKLQLESLRSNESGQERAAVQSNEKLAEFMKLLKRYA